MAKTNLSLDGKETETLVQLRCMAGWTNGIHEHLIFISALNIFLSITAFLGNTLILIAQRKESSLHPPSKLLLRCLATTDLCVGLIAEPFQVVYWLSLVYNDLNLCRYALTITFITGYTLTSVSLITITAISVDRLFALLLGLRYRQVVTLKRTYAFVITCWVFSITAATSYLTNHRIALWYGYITIPFCLGTSIFSYAKIFLVLSHNHSQVHAYPQQQQQQQQQQPSQPILLNIARYRKVVYSALWVQLALVVCYIPYSVMGAWMDSKVSSSNFIALVSSITCVYLNSTINPLLYCWKISTVRQAVKETIRQALCCPWR